MRDSIPDEYQYAIVLVGDFNPSIFHPSWFAMQELLGKSQADVAKIEIVHKQASIFTSDWLKIEVLQDRFNAYTRHEQYLEALRDLVVGTFSILSHTPLRQLGFNLMPHFRVASNEAWHEAGDRLTPKNIWDGILNKPGMISLTMQEQKEGKYKGYVRVVVEPSMIVRPGLFFTVNDHYECEADDTGNAEKIVSILTENWEPSVKRSEKIIYGLLEKLTK